MRSTARPLAPDRAQRADEPQRRRRWRSARTATCSSASATAVAAATRRTTPRTRTSSSARSSGSTSTAPGPARSATTPCRGSNPFSGSRPGSGEIWDYGLRNPWRISFDRANGKFFIADVGRAATRRSTARRPASTGGRNYGWNAMEGMHCYTASSARSPATRCRTPSTPTAAATARSPAATSTAGRPRRRWSGRTSSATGAAAGSGRIPATGPPVNSSETLRADTNLNITSFGESENGELYLVTERGRRVPGPRLLGERGRRSVARTGRRRAARGRRQDRLDVGGRAGLVERRPDDRGDDPVRVDEELGRQRVGLVRVEDLAGAVEADGVAELVAGRVGRDVGRRGLLDADRDELEPPVLVALGQVAQDRRPRTGTAGTRSSRS